MKKILLNLAVNLLILASIFSCKTRAPIIIKEKEYVLVTHYCEGDDFFFSVDDILTPYKISLQNFAFDKDDSIITELTLNKNVSYSPDNKYFIKYEFVPAQNELFLGTCKAVIYTTDTVLVSVIKNVEEHEPVLWFKDFVIFEGFGFQLTRKIIVDLTTGYSKELEELGSFELIGKSPNAAFYKSSVAGAALGTTKTTSKYSVIRLSKNEANQVYEPIKQIIPFYYDENAFILYNSVSDSFNLFINQKLDYKFQSYAIDFPFDALNYDSITYVVMRNTIFKISNERSLLSVINSRTNNKLDYIKEIRVIGDKVFFKLVREITNKDWSSSGNYTTRNNIAFNIHQARKFFSSEAKNHFVSEFGILDLRNKTIYYPQIKIVN